MGMLDAFFKDSGYGNNYQGTAKGPSLGTIFGPATSRTYFNTQQPSAAKWKNDAGFQNWLSQLFNGFGVF